MFTIGMNSYANSFLWLYDNGYRGPYRHQDLQLARHDVGGKIQFKAPMLFCIGFLLQFLIAGLTGVMMSVAPFDWQLRQLLLCRCPFPLRDRGRDPVLPFRRVLLLVSENHGKAIERNPGQNSISGSSRSVFTLTFDSMHIPGLLGMAAPYLHVRTRAWLGNMESDRNDWRFVQGIATLDICCEPCSFLL